MSSSTGFYDDLNREGRTTPESRSGTGSTPLVEKLDEKRAASGTWMFIISEGLLFLLLFFAYYYTAQGHVRWMVEDPPSLKFVLPMLAILLVSSVVLYLGERRIKDEAYGAARIAVAVTILLGLLFLVLSYFDYREHLKHLLPSSNAYGSCVYTLISLHLAHLVLGLCMLSYLLILPQYEPTTRPPHRPYHCVSLYWHFVDTVWVFIVTLLYIVPNLRT